MSEHLPEARDSIFDIEMYVPGDSGSGHAGPVIKLSSNETPLGASKKAIEAAQAQLGSLELYPDGGATALREAIAARYGLNAGQIVCGAGSDELLNLLATAYLKPGDEAIYTEHGFLVYRIAILAQGGVPVVAPERDLTTDVDAILACVTERTKMVFIANPNNPTGTYVPFDEVRRLRAGLPDHVLLVLDGAYAEYVQKNDYESGLELVATTGNTVMTRTFSKLHGLAALRLGWVFCPQHVADVLNRIRGPFNVSSVAIAAGAAAIADQAHQDAAITLNTSELKRLSGALAQLGLEVTPSVANFVLVHFPNATAALEADLYLKDRGIIVRRVASYGLPGALRISVGLPEHNDAVLDALSTFVAGDVPAVGAGVA